MTTEHDLRENTRAMKNLTKGLGELTKALQSLDRNLTAAQSVMKTEADAESERLRKEATGISPVVRGDTFAEVADGIKKFGAMAAICHACFSGMHAPGVIYSDNCSCCNKSHRKTS